MSYVITSLGIYRMGQVSRNISSSVTVTYKGQSEVRGCFLYLPFRTFLPVYFISLLLFTFSLRPALSSTPLSLQVTTMASVQSRSPRSGHYSDRSESYLESDDEYSGGQTKLQLHIDPSQPIPTSTKARAKRRIAALEEELDTLRHERGSKQR